MQANGFLFDKSNIAGIVDRLEAQKATKRDYVIPAKMLKVTERNEVILPVDGKRFAVNGRVFFDWAAAEKYSDEVKSEGGDGSISIDQGAQTMALTNTATGQLCSRLSIPKRFYDGLMGERSMGDIGGRLISDIIARDDRKFLVRTLDGRARAVLSDSYKCLDNVDLFFAAVQKFAEVGAQLWQARLWDDGMELFGTAPHISGEVTTDRTFDPGDGWQSRWYGGAGDVHNAAVRIANSETGRGYLSLSAAILRRVCANFNVWSDEVAKMHVGRKLEVGDDFMLSDLTKEKEASYIWSAVQDGIATAFDPVRFTKLIDRLNATTQVEIPKEQEVRAVDAAVAKFKIADTLKASILAQVLMTGDRSQFGLVQAMTAVAHQSSTDCEDGSHLEEAGGELAMMEGDKFLALVG